MEKYCNKIANDNMNAQVLETTGEKFSAFLRCLQNMHPNHVDRILQFLSQIKELREMQSNVLILEESYPC